MVTIRDVAREAGVSLMTASRVARKMDGVSDKTRKKVTDVMERLGYQPDQLAQALRNRCSNTIGIIVSDVENIFYIQMIAKMERDLKTLGFSMLISFSNENSEVEVSSVNMMLGARVAGIMITPVKRNDQKLEQLLRAGGVPILQLYRNVYHDFDSIIVDDMYGAYAATRRLLNEGHRDIMLLDVDWEGREKGYRLAYRESETPVRQEMIVTCQLNAPEETRIMQAVTRHHPTAIVAGTNLLGHDAVSVCNRLSLSIPRDVSMVIQDDVSWVELLGISAIRQPMDAIAEDAVRVLTGKINEQRGRQALPALPIVHHVMRPELVERASIDRPGP